MDPQHHLLRDVLGILAVANAAPDVGENLPVKLALRYADRVLAHRGDVLLTRD